MARHCERSDRRRALRLLADARKRRRHTRTSNAGREPTDFALLRAGKALDKLKGENEDQRHGIEMVKKALSWPARQIAINAGEDGSVVVGKIQDNDTYAFGFDAQTGKFENLVSEGIIDPTKVVRTALQDAASIAGLLITTEAMVAERPKKETPMPTMPGGGMGGMDY